MDINKEKEEYGFFEEDEAGSSDYKHVFASINRNVLVDLVIMSGPPYNLEALIDHVQSEEMEEVLNLSIMNRENERTKVICALIIGLKEIEIMKNHCT